VIPRETAGYTLPSPCISIEAVLGAPGCCLYVNLEVTFLLAGTGTQSRPLSIANDPSWLGLLIYSQSASFVPGVNPFGAISSNGLALEVGVL